MTDTAAQESLPAKRPSIISRRDLSRFVAKLASGIGASGHMIVEMAFERGRQSVQIITSNWVYDAVQDVGCDAIAKIVSSDHCASPGRRPVSLGASESSPLSDAEQEMLADHGHSELYCLRLRTDKRRVFALFSAATAGAIDQEALARAHMTCRYGFASFAACEGVTADRDPLSERERECLRWVSQGKTTDEIALILGVSSNTINSYVAHAIQKFGASNRAMAIATAIRSGII